MKAVGHRRHASDQLSAFTAIKQEPSSDPTLTLPHRLERLCIQPTPVEPQVNQGQSNSSPPPSFYSLPPRFSHLQPPTHHNHIHRSQRSPRNLHARSFSDYTHPYPSSSPPRTTGGVGGSLLAPLPTYHRRAVSANNALDFILQPILNTPLDNRPPSLYASSSTSTMTTQGPRSPISPHYSDTTTTTTTHTRSSSVETDEEEIVPVTRSESPPSVCESSNRTINSNGSKYQCPYCKKGFSRPSSLRIHTYSHTGERPFECPEPGCCRKFSVQSNMRRHMRIHKSGKAQRRNGAAGQMDRTQLVNKPLAAKPANWVTHC